MDKAFLTAQDVPVTATTIYQDNKSTILLLENGRMSSSKFTKHLDVQYFFVTDQIKCRELKVVYCPTEDILADFILPHGKYAVRIYSICPLMTR